MIFDFPAAQSKLSKQLSSQEVIVGVATAFNFVQSPDKVRLIINVANLVPYSLDNDGNKVVITLDNDTVKPNQAKTQNYTISSLDFHRGQAGEGRLSIDFTNESVPTDFSETEEDITILFKGATIPEKLIRHFDVSDFGTNIQKVNVSSTKDGVAIQIIATGEYEKFAYQLDKQYIVEVRPLIEGALAEITAQKFKFTGEKISLNFQDIPIRAVIQLIADFTNLNIVVSDSVDGNVTIRLDNIPWDEALAFILQSKGLAQRANGNIILVGPSDEINAREQLSLQAQQQAQSLAPLQSEFIQVDYAKASDIASAIKDASNNLLSSRGQITVDPRTNTLLVKDTAENIDSIRTLVERLDIPVKQILIEAQIVEADYTFNDHFGFQLTTAATGKIGKYPFGAGPTLTDAQANLVGPKSLDLTNFNVNFADASTTALGLVFNKLPGGTLLGLELQAAEAEIRSKTIARPKLITQDQQQASIQTGQEIPYTTTSQAGATPTTTFQTAVLKLQVTPAITPNNKVNMNVSITDDSPVTIPGATQIGINTTSMSTNILVDDGETAVLGGIFKIIDDVTTNSIPYLSKIPILGRLFTATAGSVTRTEILMFITPHILKTTFSKS